MRCSGLRAPAITDELLASDRAHENDNLIVRITHLLLYIVRHSFNFADHAKFRERIDEFPEFRHRLKVHHINCEQVLIDYLNTVDWDAFNAAGRHGPLITRPENMPLTETAEERTVPRSSSHPRCCGSCTSPRILPTKTRSSGASTTSSKLFKPC